LEGALGIGLDAERSTRQILTAGWALYRRFPWLFLTLAVAVMAPFDLAVLAILGVAPLHGHHQSFPASLALTLLRGSLIGPLISALHIHALVVIGRGERPRLREVAVRGLEVLPVVVAADAVATVAAWVGFLLIVIPGVIATLMLAVSAQAAALERQGWIGALRRSRDLTDDHYLHVFTVLLWPGLLGAAALFGVGELPLRHPTGVASVLVGIAVESLVASYSALTLALLYFDLKSRASARSRAR
jgi:hypothetical protein